MSIKIESKGIVVDGILLPFTTNKIKTKDGFINNLQGSSVDNWNLSGKKMWYYQKWRCMRRRASLPHKYPDVSVHDDWKLFSNFILDISKLSGACIANFELDKDLHNLDNNKIYSKHTCTLLPKSINVLLAKKINTKKKSDLLLQELQKYSNNLDIHTFNKLTLMANNYASN